MSTLKGSKFAVGPHVISYTAASPALLAEIAKVLPISPDDDLINDSMVKELSSPFADLEEALIAISKCILGELQDYLWIDAAVLIAPNGATVLLCGASEAGKSTLTAALSEMNWKVVSEDVAIIYPDGSIPPLIRPISLRPGTAERIYQQTGLVLDVVDDRWHYKPEVFHTERLQLPLSVVLDMKGVNPEDPGDLVVTQTTPHQLVRELLPCSNALRIADGTDFLFRCLEGSKYWQITGGSIADRINALNELAKQAISSPAS